VTKVKEASNRKAKRTLSLHIKNRLVLNLKKQIRKMEVLDDAASD